MNDAAELGRLIRESRLKKGMSLSQLAAAVGRSSSSVRRWERGEVPPAQAIIVDLASALDLEASQLDDLRPTSDAPDEDPESSAGKPKHTTLEQPVVTPVSSPPIDYDSDASTAAEVASGRPTGIIGDLGSSVRAWTRDWSSWIRAGLTVVVLVAMLIVLVWAVGELVVALGEIWDSFDAEPGR